MTCVGIKKIKINEHYYVLKKKTQCNYLIRLICGQYDVTYTVPRNIFWNTLDKIIFIADDFLK